MFTICLLHFISRRKLCVGCLDDGNYNILSAHLMRQLPSDELAVGAVNIRFTINPWAASTVNIRFTINPLGC